MNIEFCWQQDPDDIVEQLQVQQEVELAQRERMRRWYAELASLKGDRLYKAKNKALLRFKESIRRAGKAMPKWLSEHQLESMYRKYKKAVEREFWTGEPHEVHHMVPLAGRVDRTEDQIVSGLHVPWNLEVTTQIKNREQGPTVSAELLGYSATDPYGASTLNGDDRLPF